MNNRNRQVKAQVQAIDEKIIKAKIFYAGAALLLGLLAMAIFTSKTRIQGLSLRPIDLNYSQLVNLFH